MISISLLSTVTMQLSLLPLLVVTVIVAVPGAMAVISPSLTTATSGASLLQVSVRSSVVSPGMIVAFSVPLSPSVSVMLS